MDVLSSTIKFSYLRRELEGKVMQFTPANRTIIRVYVEMNIKGLPKEQVFIFYKLDNGKLFWHDLNVELKQDMAKLIAKSIQPG
jgi:hypothetical protein